MMCEVLCKQVLREVAYRSSCLRRKCLFRAFHVASKSLGCRATYTQLHYLANEAVTPKVTATEIKHFIEDKEFKFQEGYACLRLPCPICTIGKIGKLDSTMYINKITGTFICYSCKHSGNWHLFQKYVSALRANDEKRLKFSKSEKGIFLTEEEEQKLQEILNSSCNISDLTKEEILKTSEKFCIEDFNSSCLKSFDIRISADRHCLLLPIRGFNCRVAGLYMLSLEKSSDNLHNYSIFPRKEIAALFGRYDSSNCKEVVLTSNPLDAMAVSQQTDIPGICVPQSTSLSEEVLPLMENFKKIIIWYGDNTQEDAAVTNIAKIMGESRCHLVYSQKDHVTPLTCLQKNQSVANVLKKAQPFIHRSIIKPCSIRDKVLARICNKEETLGVKAAEACCKMCMTFEEDMLKEWTAQKWFKKFASGYELLEDAPLSIVWTRFPALNLLLKGLRPGELTIFTGPTGSGKTTFISEYSLDICMQGVCTLWGSFEINNERLLKTMLTQFAQIPLEKHPEECHFWADKFEQLPLYLMTFHGEASLSSVLDAMTHAVCFYKVQHIVIDNVQFMLGTGDMNSSMDRFWQQDKLISSFRKFATLYNCHVTLVMHPRKNCSKAIRLRTGNMKEVKKIGQPRKLKNNKQCDYLPFDGINLREYPKRARMSTRPVLPIWCCHNKNKNYLKGAFENFGERESEELNNYSIFGGAKASQEADNILILQDKRATAVRGRKYLQLTKNRFDGDLGMMSLEFDKETLSFAVKKKQRVVKNIKTSSREIDSSEL